ncbi:MULTISPECIES: dihydropteroate synthase [Bizionia]|uniref:Dihydropteroate synthase n=1 Tax=Bizionia algoritergicola TaxID=291187 RepID=A0A5D0QUS7_9FLAO|nr:MULTISPECIES: dihydropteroate synthase [Bizionia]OBX21714.1 dihydropteroate synthase [Bizionia sp. APA-3]TYB71954.1 dihydropteroate synthase [Bizionia algoritergicola]
MTINCKGNLIDLSTPKVMGILNLTPDSFYDGGKYKNKSEVFFQVETMLHQGATFIDVGAYSSKPNANFVSETEELNRIIPVIQALVSEFPNILLSVDTFRSEVAKESILAGAAVINDISAGKLDDNMLEVVGKLQVPYIMMHMRGTPQTMQNLTEYESLVKDILFYFSERVFEAKKHHITDIIIDPGFGFAKTREQNFELLNHLEQFKILEKLLLVGVSRKSMIYKTLENTANNALNGTTVLNTIALQKGANMLRVHDVQEAMECIKLTNEMN